MAAAEDERKPFVREPSPVRRPLAQPSATPEEIAARALKRRLRPALLSWFDQSARTLPWRGERDPYAVWVSEVMLQQTQVDRVIPFYQRFLARLPTIESLAGVDLGDVLALWRGLGYYSRARHLHAGARLVVERHHGRLPSTIQELLALPGFGRYTAGAVASIAFGQPAPLIDGNVARVFSRLFLIEGGPGDRAREALLWRLAAMLVDGPRPGDFNQSLMELGATVCLPSGARCARCPVARHCQALAASRVDELPRPRRVSPRRRLELAVALARLDGAIVLGRRPDSGLFGGLWELPSAEKGDDGASSLRELLGAQATVGPRVLVVERTLTHRQLVLHLHRVELPLRLPPAPSSYVEWRWLDEAATATLGISSAMGAALAEARAAESSKRFDPRRRRP